MKKLLSVATATILATAFALPLNAAPMFVPNQNQCEPTSLKQSKTGKTGTAIVTGGVAAIGTIGTHGGKADTGTTGMHGGIAATMALVIPAATTATVITTRATIGRTTRATIGRTTRATISPTIRATIRARELAFI
jgi:hypothetical protein